MTTVGLLLGPDSRLYDVAVTREVFSDRPDLSGAFALRILAGSPTVRLDDGVVLSRTDPLGAAGDCDLLVVPGSVVPRGEPDRARLRAVHTAYDNGATVASLCTGAFHLAATGLLDGREATTHWRYSALLAERYPRVRVTPDVLFAGGERVWTSAGVTAGTDLLLHLVRADAGAEAAGVIARSMVTPAFRVGSQAQFVPSPSRGPEPGSWVEALQAAVVAEPARVWSLGELAARASMSARTLTRRFRQEVGTSPGDWVIGQRVRIAQSLLESTDLSVERVAHDAGFSSADLLRKHFTRHLGVSPTTHRSQLRAVPLSTVNTRTS